MTTLAPDIHKLLLRGGVIPASPLALTANRRLDERRQRALYRYYSDAGAQGIAVGVHTTQFQIRDPQIGLFRLVLALAAEEMDRADAHRAEPLVRVAGVCGQTEQAVVEARTVRELGYHAALLSLAAMKEADDDGLIAHCRAVAEIVPLIGFYLQPAVGGRRLSYAFWRRFAGIENVVAIKIAPFNRYQTLDVIRAVAESGRDDIALYTGNDDNIVLDLLTPYRFRTDGRTVERRIVGGLLGHWSVWTRSAVKLLRACHEVTEQADVFPELLRPFLRHHPAVAENLLQEHERILPELLHLSVEVTDSNAAFFDAANSFAGCIAGLHDVLRRQGLLEGIWCLDPNETLSPGQKEEIDRVYAAYPHLNDDAFVAANRDRWLSG